MLPVGGIVGTAELVDAELVSREVTLARRETGEVDLL